MRLFEWLGNIHDINLGAIPQQIPQLPITKLENLFIYFYSNLPRGNKLTTVRVQHKNSFITLHFGPEIHSPR